MLPRNRDWRSAAVPDGGLSQLLKRARFQTTIESVHVGGSRTIGAEIQNLGDVLARRRFWVSGNA